jgi:hypothetical protein
VDLYFYAPVHLHDALFRHRYPFYRACKNLWLIPADLQIIVYLCLDYLLYACVVEVASLVRSMVVFLTGVVSYLD